MDKKSLTDLSNLVINGPIGIIGAMKCEIDRFLKILEKPTTSTIWNQVFHHGEIFGIPVIITECGIGKVNAAFVTTLIISNSHASAIINTGIAGSLNPVLKHLSVVIPSTIVYHDFDLTPLGYLLNRIPGHPICYEPDPIIVKILKEANESTAIITDYPIATGDIFVSTKEQRDTIQESTHAFCVDMETASIAQVCYLTNSRFVSIRCISDSADESVDTTYLEQEASTISSEFLLNFFHYLSTRSEVSTNA